MTIECGSCAAPVMCPVVGNTEPEARTEVTCPACAARHALLFEPREIDEDGTIEEWRCVRWWCRHGVVDHEECAACSFGEDA